MRKGAGDGEVPAPPVVTGSYRASSRKARIALEGKKKSRMYHLESAVITVALRGCQGSFQLFFLVTSRWTQIFRAHVARRMTFVLSKAETGLREDIA